MRLPLAYTPPDLPEAGTGPVRRRHVFFVPGYDPEARTRYRLLFVRELLRYAKRFGEGRRTVSSATLSPDGLVQSWRIASHPPSGGAATRYDVLLWDDIVARDYARPRATSIALLVIGTLHALVWGAIWRFYRYNHRYGNVIVYPFAMVVLLALVSVLIGTLVHASLGDGFGYSLGLPLWASLPLGIAAGIAWILVIETFLNRLFFWQLLNTWVFNWQHGQLWRPDFEARVDAFVDHVVASLARDGEAAPDEIMIVGHSVGALAAVELAARVLARAPALEEGGSRLALVTLGSALPLVAIQPLAERLRAEIASLVTTRRIVWCDFQTMQDWMNFPGFNPVLDLELGLDGGPIANPIVRSTQLKQVLEPETYEKVLYRPFRIHFQCLLANERPGDYDFFRLTLGSQYLRDRAVVPIVGPEPVVAGRADNPA